MIEKSYTQIHTITGLRGFASLWVVLAHTCYGARNNFLPGFDGKIEWGLVSNFINLATLAVDIFFIISGFVIALVYGEKIKNNFNRKEILHYYILRIARIYPLHVATIIFLILIWFVTGNSTKTISISDVLLSLTLTNVMYYPSVNLPAWSVSAEWLAYLAFPILWLLITKIRSKRAAIITIPLLMTLYIIPSITHDLKKEWIYGYTAILRIAVGFTIGCLIYKIHKQPSEPKPADYPVCFFFSLCFIVTFCLSGVPFYITYIFLPFFIFYTVKAPKIAEYTLSNSVTKYLGKISYAIYLMHYPILEIFRIGLNDYYSGLDKVEDQTLIRTHLGLIVLSIIIVSALAYHYIEKPLRDRIKIYLGKYK